MCVGNADDLASRWLSFCVATFSPRIWRTSLLRACRLKYSPRRISRSASEAANGGSDRFIDAMVLHGDAASVKAGLRAHFTAGATHVCIQPVTEDGDTAHRDAMLAALADT
jgi:hypothetical protein